MTRTRYSLGFDSWPQVDKAALLNAFELGGLFAEGGHASHWAPHTRQSIIKTYGQWLDFVRRNGLLDSEVSPVERVTVPLLTAYVRELEARVSPVSVDTLMRGLSEALRVMEPAADRCHIQQAAAHIRRNSKPSRDKRQRLVAPAELFRAGIARMDLYRSDATQDPLAAVRFGDGLMMSMLAAKPVRRKNLVGTRVGIHIHKLSNGHYEWCFREQETKTRERIVAELPATLTLYIDMWLGQVRDLLLGARQSSAMWLTTKGTDMAQDTFYARFCRATERELGVRINPHLVRDIVATGIAVEMPEVVQITPMILDHRTDQSARKYYNLADQMSASARYLAQLERLRVRAIGGMQGEASSLPTLKNRG